MIRIQPAIVNKVQCRLQIQYRRLSIVSLISIRHSSTFELGVIRTCRKLLRAHDSFKGSFFLFSSGWKRTLRVLETQRIKRDVYFWRLSELVPSYPSSRNLAFSSA
ncbi:hypothetical protein FPOAC2_04800 [Fusarium poae]